MNWRRRRAEQRNKCSLGQVRVMRLMRREGNVARPPTAAGGLAAQHNMKTVI